MIQYYSTEGKSDKVSFKDALLKGLAPDRGLYFPERIPAIDREIFGEKVFKELSNKVMKLLIDGEMPDEDIKSITADAFNFPVPLKQIHDNIYIMELFHGPTAAFKDFGARFMARTMSYFLEKVHKKVTILVATSGDTGSAVAKGFHNVPNIDVIILYPKGKVSELQEKQMTTLGGNVTALEVRGTFDDCQRLVKDAFTDKTLDDKINLSSANSINIGRLFPQMLYYFWAYNQLKDVTNTEEIIFCTPSGNFGNLTGGLLAKKMGLPVKKFIAATNINDVVPEYLNTGVFKARPSMQTFSNAMDVGDPSNFARMLEIYPSKTDMSEDIIGYSATNEETLETIRKVYIHYGYVMDPHGAVGYKAIQDYIDDTGERKTPIVLLETAHPAKFGEIIEKAISKEVEIPDTLLQAFRKEKQSVEIDAHYGALKDFLLSNFVKNS